jgi:preprotein translocase subunit Sss1
MPRKPIDDETLGWYVLASLLIVAFLVGLLGFAVHIWRTT